jgi:hypothetical protein
MASFELRCVPPALRESCGTVACKIRKMRKGDWRNLTELGSNRFKGLYSWVLSLHRLHLLNHHLFNLLFLSRLHHPPRLRSDKRSGAPAASSRPLSLATLYQKRTSVCPGLLLLLASFLMSVSSVARHLNLTLNQRLTFFCQVPLQDSCYCN